MNEDFKQFLVACGVLGIMFFVWGLSAELLLLIGAEWWTALMSGLGLAMMTGGAASFVVDALVKKTK